jgi:cobalt-zinc-cadmium resistance protein CzcA
MREAFGKLLQKRTLWVLLYAGLIAYGVHALIQIPVEVLPAFDFPQVNIIAQWPGAGARELETSVTRPLEAELLALPHLDNLRSAMGGGIVTLTARFRDGTRPTQDLQAVYGAIDRAKSVLPPGVAPYAQVMGNAVNEVADYAVALSPGVRRLGVRLRIENNVLPTLRGLPGVQRVELIGGGAPSLWVQPQPAALAQAGFTLSALARSLRHDLVLAPAGYFNWGHQQVLASVHHLPAGAAALSRWFVTNSKGQRVPLQSVANVIEAPKPVLHDVRLDGRPSLYLVILKQQGASTGAVDDAVADALHQLTPTLPQGAHFVPIYRQAHVLRLIGTDLGRNLLIGGALAILMLAFFLGAGREVWILALTIPLSLLVGIAVLYALGQTLNLMTLGALTVAVGLLADDGILVLESIVHEWEYGYSGIAGIHRGLAVIALPDVIGTITTVAVFIPLLLAGGLAGLFTAPFALAMIAALLASLVVSLSLVPVLMSGLANRLRRVPFKQGQRVLVWLRTVNASLFRQVLHRPRLALGIGLGFVTVSFAALILVPFNFLPLPNEGVLLDAFSLPPGTALPEVERTIATMTQRLRHDPAVAHVLVRIGSPARSSYTEHSNSGEIQVVLKPGVHASRLDRIAHRLKAEAWLPGVEQSYDTPTIERVGESLSGLPQPFVVRIEGQNISTLERLTEKAAKRLRHSGAFSSLFANDAYPVNRLVIEPRAATLAAHDVSASALSNTLALGLGGKVLGRIPEGNSYLDLYLRLARPQDMSPRRLAQLPVGLDGGRVVPLGELARISLHSAPSALRHLNGARMLEITGQPNGSFGTAAVAAQRVLSTMHWPSGYRFSIGGLYKEFEHTALVLVVVGIAALVLMVGILLLHFDGWLKPALILLEVPLAFGGGAAALAISRIGLNLLGLVGFITLIGISLNHAIILFDRVRRNEVEGHSSQHAIEEAIAVRFRPILLTTLTAVLGALPTAVGWGIGAAPEQGLAVVLVGGMLWTSLLSTNLIPALYLHWSRHS